MNRTNIAGLGSLLGQGAKVDVTPSLVISRSWNRFEFKITLGTGGLAPDDSLGVVCGSNTDRWQFQFASHIWGCYTPWQTHDPAAPNFLTARCSQKDVELDVRIGGSGGLKPFHNQPDHFVRSLVQRFRYVLEISASKKLNKGDTISITWGDTIYGSAGVQAPCIAVPYFFLPFKFSLLPTYDRDLPIKQGNYEVLPSIRVTGKSATRFHCAVKPLVTKGRPIRMHCAAVDEYGNLDENFQGTVTIKCSDKTADLPEKLIFEKRHKGQRKVNGIRINKTGWQNLYLVGENIKSSPHQVLVSETAPQEQIYFGDMHAHTLDCDGTFRSDDHYSYARNVAGLDFCSLAAHAEYFGTEAAWKKYLRAATEAHVAGKFVTFYGYEWAAQGHTNAYFLEENDVVNIYGKRILRGRHPRDDPEFRIPCNTEQRFLEKIKALESASFCITHWHSAYVPPVDDSVIWLHEIYSMHQQNTLDRKYQDILAQGLKIGAVAGSDSHRLPIGSLCPHPDKVWQQPVLIDGHIGSQSMQKKCGLQATYATSLSRQSLYQSMQRRFTYGTTGARIVLLFEINGAQMGAEVCVDPNRELHMAARVGGTSNLTEVCVMMYDGKAWSTLARKTKIGALSYDLEQTIPPLQSDFLCYLRVKQEDGECAWSSPVWIKNRL